MINKKYTFLLWLLLFMGSTIVFSADYRHVFGRDWTQAEQYVKEHHSEWKEIFIAFDVDSRIAEAIVFPELIRYSMWKDEIEQAAVNGLYVSKGKTGADFSVGRFQMKPSFAEEVEKDWNNSNLSKDYSFAFNLHQNTEARRSRIRRLATIEGQCRYLAMFIRLQMLRHPQLSQLPPKEQVRCLATLYNRSYAASWEELQTMKDQCHFHTDVIRTRYSHLFCYADIAAAAYVSMVPERKD